MPVSPKTFLSSIALMAASTLASGTASAEDLSADQIKRALMPELTRSLSLRETPDQASDQAFVDSIRNKSSAALSSNDRSKLDAVATSKPSVDLVMEFAYNSDVLRGPALETADKLGQALSDPQLKGQTFAIEGHTDGKGSDQANQKLSERRAESVKRYLIKKFNLDASNLIAVGFGKTKLKNAASPFAQENRRVQAVNMLPFKSAAQ